MVFCQIARFKRQRAVETKLQEIQERRERHGRSIRASAFSTPVGDQDEEEIDDDGEEEREVVINSQAFGLHEQNLAQMFWQLALVHIFYIYIPYRVFKEDCQSSKSLIRRYI